MARYERGFKGISGGFGPVQGRDPNYRDGYHGMPFHVEEGQAPYGAWRWHHRQDLQTSGGFRGAYDDAYRGDYDRGYRSYDRGYRARGGPSGPSRRFARERSDYDRGFRSSGGVRHWHEHPELLRHFNSESPELYRRRGDYDDGGPRHPGQFDRGPHRSFDYHNRGISSGGFSESWARGPRGAR